MIAMSLVTVNRPRSALRRLDDFSRQDGFKLSGIRMLVPQVTERVTTPPYNFQPCAFHDNVSFSRFKRSLIRAISRFGVLRPRGDFF